jgi:hypothetical protein
MLLNCRRISGASLPFFLSVATLTWAAASDYRFELVSAGYKVGAAQIIEVRLTDLRLGAPVDGAVIFATRMDMAPDGMETMTSAVKAVPVDQPGHYRFVTDLTMEGRWRFSLAAKVQGEPETVTTRMVIEVLP